MLTRSQVARRIGRSVATVRRMEGRSLHPGHGPRGARIFDPDEVEDVAERIARSGRALDDDQRDFIEQCDFAGRIADGERRSGIDAQLRKALLEVARLKHLLRQAGTDQEEWTSRVVDAVNTVIAAVGTSDEDILEAIDELVGTLRRE
jgi:hypothetical protein